MAKTKKWRNLWSGRIQTYSKFVWLWDSQIGIATKVDVPSRPWNKINPDFTHWMPATEERDEPAPANVPAGVKRIAKELFLDHDIIMGDDDTSYINDGTSSVKLHEDDDGVGFMTVYWMDEEDEDWFDDDEEDDEDE